mgnify:CR=1 FL=1
MARRKYKLTGFARFFIVMLFLAPIAYLAASYINGEDGVENIKSLFSGKQADDQPRTTTLEDKGNPPKQAQTKAEMEALIYELKDSLRAKEFEIRELQRQIRLLKGASE